MTEIAPLHGVRFQRDRSGPIGPLIAPPYDVAPVHRGGAEFSISAIENVDLGHPGSQHGLSAARYQAWLAAGVLRPDPKAAVYLHRHRFPVDGAFVERMGLIARVRLHDWVDRVILPHEAVFAGPRLERLARLQAVGANLSPLYFLFRDPDGDVGSLLTKHVAGDEPSPAMDRMGGTHHLSAITDVRFHEELAALFAHRTLFVADGHHRYEAALAHRDRQRMRHPGVDGPWEYVLALIAAVEDPGVLVRPTHRVLTGGSPLPASLLIDELNRWFDLSSASRSSQDAGAPLFTVIGAETGQEWTARARPGNSHDALFPPGRGQAWRSLGVSAVEGLLKRLRSGDEAAGERQVLPIVEETTAIAQVHRGQAHAAFLLPSPSIDQLVMVAEQGDLLPPKSSWFEPKAPAGLVINDLERSAPGNSGGR